MKPNSQMTLGVFFRQCVGIDISKDKFTACLYMFDRAADVGCHTASVDFANTRQGFNQLVKWSRKEAQKGYATTDSLQRVVNQLDSQVVVQKAEAAQKAEADEQRMAAMNEGLNAVTTASQSLQQAQDASVRRQGQVAAAAQQGRRNVDQAMRATHIKEHLDTLTSYKYVRPNFNLDLLAGHDAIERYMSQLQGQFSAAELATIRKRLEDYYRSAWLDPLNRKLGVR